MEAVHRMLSLRHAVAQRLTANLPLSTLRFLATSHGDPGPQTSANRKSQRHRLREATIGQGGGNAIDGDTFRSILSADPIPAPESRPRETYPPAGGREPRRPREPVSTGRDGGLRRDRPARVFDQATGKWKFVGAEAGVVRPDGPRERFKLQDIKAFNAARGKSDFEGGTRMDNSARDFTRQHDYSPSSPRLSSNSQAARNSPYPSNPSQRTTYPPRSPSGAWRNGPSAGRSRDDPFTTSSILRDHIQAHPSPMTNQQVEAALRIVETAPKSAVNVVVWNQLLALLGREGRMEKMWKAFNDMKKTGIQASAHTYTSLLNSYAGLAHSSSPFSPTSTHSTPPPNHLSRVTIIWKQAQTHLATISSAPSGLDVPDSQIPAEGNFFGPVNAYLKFLARYRMWEEMWTLYQEAKGKEETWDRVGYTTLFQALLSLSRRQVAEAREAGDKRSQVMVGPMAKELWDDMVQILEGKRSDEGGLDNLLAGLGVGTLLMGRPEDQRFAMSLIPTLWDLTPLPSASPPEAIVEPTSETSDAVPPRLPNLNIDIKTATSLLHSLSTASRPSLASHYASLLLSRPRLRRDADPPFLYAAATAFAVTGDITAVLDLLQKHGNRPPTGGWKMGMWYDCLSAARWARIDGEGGGKGDWEGMKSVLGWMGVIPKTASPASEVEGDQDWKRKRASTGPITQTKVELDAKSMTIILKTALGRNKAQVVEAVQILEKAGVENILRRYQHERIGGEGRHLEKRWEWSKELSRDMGRALEGLGERDLEVYSSNGTRHVVGQLLRVKEDTQRHEMKRGPFSDERDDRWRSDREDGQGGQRRHSGDEGRRREGGRGRVGLDLSWKR